MKDYSKKTDVLFLNTNVIPFIPPEELNDQKFKKIALTTVKNVKTYHINKIQNAKTIEQLNIANCSYEKDLFNLMVWFITYRQFNSANEAFKPIRDEFVKMHDQSKKANIKCI